MISQSSATEDPWKNETINKPQIRLAEEGFLKKDEKYFLWNPYRSDAYLPIRNFDNVFPLSTTKDKTLQMFASQVFVRKRHSTEMGTASVTKSDGYTFEAVSAKHVFEGSISAHMYQGRGIVNGKTNYLYKGIIEETCHSKHRDLTLVKGRYEDYWVVPNREQRQFLKNSSVTLCSSPTISNLGKILLPFRFGFFSTIVDRFVKYPTAYIFGHPVGVPDQRVRSGLVFPHVGRHEISTLPGDSGAGLLLKVNGSYRLFGVHTGGSVDASPIRKVEIQGYSNDFREYKYNQFLELTPENLINEFTNCVRIENRPVIWRLQHGISSFYDRFQ
jgi:hypothetical protein